MSTAVTPREGSSLHYSLLWTDERLRTQFLDRLGMIHELSGTLDDVSDSGVAQRKIHWWHEEIERLIKGCARHPSLQAVSESLGERRQALKPLIDILSTAASNRFTPADTDAEADDRLATEFQARLRLLAHALDEDDTTLGLPSDDLSPIALALGRHDQLFRLPRLLYQGHSVFSSERFDKHNLAPQQLADGTRQERDQQLDTPRQALLREAVLAGCNAFSQAAEDLGCQRFLKEEHHGALALLTPLRARQLTLWRDREPDLLRERITLTPVRKWFLAWRAQRAIRP